MTSCIQTAFALPDNRSSRRRLMRTRVVRRWSAWGVLAATLLLVVPRASAGGTNTTCTETEFAYLVSGGGSVVFTQDCSITLSEPVPVNLITTIDAQGHNVTLSGGNLVQIFRVATGAQLTGIGLTLTGGLGTNGGALFVDSGAILVLTNCTVTGNSAMGTNGVAGAPGATNTANGIGGNGGNGTPGAAAAGGALYNFGSVMLLNCTFTSNNVTGGDGGAGGAGGSEVTEGGNGGTGGNGATAYGGAIYNGYNLTLTNCTFSGNTAGAGAGGSGGAAGSGVFTGLAGNGGAGGSAGGAGIWNAQNLTMAACTFSVNQVQGGNSAAGGSQVNGVGTTGARGGDASGGGLHSGWWGRIVNCTFYNNTVIGGTGGDGGPGSGTLPEGGNGGNGGNGNGGGLDNAGTLGVTNCTIANCSAIGGTNGAAGSGAYPGSPGNVGSANGGGIANVSGTLNLANSILATNLAGANAFGTIVAGGYDLSSDYTPSSLTSTNRNKDPLLGSLANNGGPTQTIALRSTNSPAYAQIPAGTPGLPPIDQRGAPRPGPGKPRADMGAYELLTSPGIAQDPSSVVQTNTGTVTFSVSAAGDSLYYLWHYAPTNFYYGTNVLSGVATNYPVSTSSNLTLSSITITNVGNYWVDVTNRYGLDTSTAATLSMPPFIAAQPTNIETGVGADATFQVIAASDQPLTYQWYLNQTNALATQTNWFYKLTNAQLTDDGSTYSVVVTNTLGSITSVVATLTVDSPPEILVNPTNRTVVQGTDIHFLVAASGTQPLAYQWRFNGNPKAGYTTTDCPVYGARTNNAGNYDVVITNRFGSVTSAPPAVLKVQGPLPINGPKLVAKSLLFTFQTLAGLTYTVEYKNRLTDTNWTALVNYAGTDGIISASDPATNQPGRFYRVRVH